MSASSRLSLYNTCYVYVIMSSSECGDTIFITIVSPTPRSTPSRLSSQDIIRASDGTSMLGGQTQQVDFSTGGAGGCVSGDLLGFCYASPLATPVALPPGGVYYIVSQVRRQGGREGGREGETVNVFFLVFIPLSSYRSPANAVPPHSQETAGEDAYLEMTNPAAATSHTVRDGTTSLTHAGPGLGRITGRVERAGAAGAWRIVKDIDTAFGPVNWVMQQQ